jgi:hypothetical protein
VFYSLITLQSDCMLLKKDPIVTSSSETRSFLISTKFNALWYSILTCFITYSDADTPRNKLESFFGQPLGSTSSWHRCCSSFFPWDYGWVSVSHWFSDGCLLNFYGLGPPVGTVAARRALLGNFLHVRTLRGWMLLFFLFFTIPNIIYFFSCKSIDKLV